MTRELIIKGGYIVTVDPKLGDLPDGDVLVRDDIIAAVGPALTTSALDAEVIDARGRLVIPGLVDTHRHVWQGAIGGFTPQITGAGYEPEVLHGIAPRHAPQDIYAGTLWGALQALDAGITTIADWAHNLQSAEHADADLRGLQDSGIRGYFLYGGPGPASDDPNPPHPLDARRMRGEQFASGTNGRLRMGMALRGPCFTSAERNAQDFAFARDLGLPISLHVGMAGTADAITTLQRFNLLGADVNYAHGNTLTDEEFDLIAASRGTLSITPSTDMLMQFGTFPGTGRALQRGVVCGLGVDTICSAGTDLFSEMRLALAAERSRANADALARGERVPTVDLHQRDMLRLATLDGARVWGLQDEVGSLSPGKQADIAVLDLRSPHLDGFGDPVAVMVLGAGPADVETVIVGGDIVKRHGSLTGAHVEAGRTLMHETRERLRHEDQPKSTSDALHALT
ncbi:MAG TPA: amidohydrolase family protein [Solirubrobacteraceae bacterium]|jgi:cytosine/adenosine deaminase-related metal-dependent hydrolase